MVPTKLPGQPGWRSSLDAGAQRRRGATPRAKEGPSQPGRKSGLACNANDSLETKKGP